MVESRRYTKLLRLSLIIFITVVIWYFVTVYGSIPRFILPNPADVAASLFHNPNAFYINARATLEITLVGFLISVLFGVVLALIIVQFRFVEDTVLPLLVSLNSIPKVALAPLFVIWLGTTAPSKIAVVVSIAIFPIVIDTILGLRSVEPDAIHMARSLRASKLRIFWHIRMPQALPSLFVGMKVSISLALVGAIVAEFVAGNIGLGSMILTAQGLFNVEQVFVCIILLSVMGYLLYYIIDILEGIFIPWHYSRRK